MDTEIWDHYLALLFEKNLVVVYDLKRSKAAKGESSAATANSIQFNRPVFKAQFADATDHITQLFFIKDFQRSVDFDDASDSDESQSKKRGYSSDDSEDAQYQASSKSARKQLEGQQAARHA